LADAFLIRLLTAQRACEGVQFVAGVFALLRLNVGFGVARHSFRIADDAALSMEYVLADLADDVDGGF
jgi:hypothetical protein